MTKEILKKDQEVTLEDVKDMSIEDMMIQVLTSQKQVKVSQEAIRKDVEEVRALANEIDKKVHIDDVEASEIKSIIGSRAYHYAKEFFEKEGTLPSQNLFSSKKGQFIRIQHSRLKKYFNVTKYTHIKHTDAERAFDFLKTLSFDDFTAFEIRETPKQKEIRALEMQLLA